MKEAGFATIDAFLSKKEFRMIRRIVKISGWIATVAFVGFSFASETKKESNEDRRERLRIAVQESLSSLGKISNR
jgi:hypothetical protein